MFYSSIKCCNARDMEIKRSSYSYPVGWNGIVVRCSTQADGRMGGRYRGVLCHPKPKMSCQQAMADFYGLLFR